VRLHVLAIYLQPHIAKVGTQPNYDTLRAVTRSVCLLSATGVTGAERCQWLNGNAALLLRLTRACVFNHTALYAQQKQLLNAALGPQWTWLLAAC
jgi:hypothetical protein